MMSLSKYNTAIFGLQPPACIEEDTANDKIVADTIDKAN